MSPAVVSKNVKVNGRRTSMRMEATNWAALEEIARRERLTIHDLCSHVEQRLQQRNLRRPPAENERKATLAGAVRVFITAYLRQSATEQGHELAGHGRGHPFVGTPFERRREEGSAKGTTALAE